MEKGASNINKKVLQKSRLEVTKSPLDMTYKELNNTLDKLLRFENLPFDIDYRGNKINYDRYSKFRLLIIGLYRVFIANLFFRKEVKKRLGSFKRAPFLRSFRNYFYIFQVGLPDLLVCLNGKFNVKIVANYMIAAMFYDCSCDFSEYRKYLNIFNDFIMFDKNIEPRDEFLTIFKESMDYLKANLDKNTYDTFMNYIKIEHICQLMSLYQLSDKKISRDHLFKITLAKGGITIMAGIYLMAPKMTRIERKALYEIGGVLQILEDINDIKEDLKMGIKTLSNQKMINYQELKQLYFGTVNNLIETCNIDINQANGTLDIMCWIADVVLEQRYKKYFT